VSCYTICFFQQIIAKSNFDGVVFIRICFLISLKIVNLFEVIGAGGSQIILYLVWDTKKNERIIHELPFHVFIVDAIDLRFTLVFFE